MPDESARRTRREARRPPPLSPPPPAPEPSELPQSTPPGAARGSTPEQRQGFTPLILDRMVIALPLLNQMQGEREQRTRGMPEPAPVYQVIIDVNLDYRGGREGGRQRIERLIEEAIAASGTPGGRSQGVNQAKTELSDQYIFATLEGEVIRTLVSLDRQAPRDAPAPAAPVAGTEQTGKPQTAHRAIYRIWPDFAVKALLTRSLSTIKADAARTSFAALGEGIVWAVVDSGVQQDHPHFARYGNLVHPAGPLQHRDFTAEPEQPLIDRSGHGTHVAGIIAGEMTARDPDHPRQKRDIRAAVRSRDEHGDVQYERVKLDAISGVAPRCTLVSLKVLDDNGDGVVSNIIAALAHVHRMNDYGRRLRIHGVNLSVGYTFEPEWFACGQSPLCVEVDRLVRSGVVVVVAAGNTGYGWEQSATLGAVAAGMDLTINDPGNADLAITVGSTHRDMPHVYGVSYFSSKGPTGDGRLKPDLVAPGEKILSCAAGSRRETAKETAGFDCDYVEDSGTSMAAPHVSGAVAAFLSIRREFIGQPETVKDIFLTNATDLKRERTFQGHGLLDLLRAIQAV